MRPPPLDRSVRLVGKASGEELIKHETQRVDVAANAGLALSDLLWSHVGRRTRSFAPAKGIVAAQGQAEVGDAHPPSSIEHDVGGFQIAMQQPAIMGGGEASADLVRGLQSLVARASGRYGATKMQDPRRRCTPWSESAGRSLLRCRKHGKHLGAKPGGRCGLQHEIGESRGIVL